MTRATIKLMHLHEGTQHEATMDALSERLRRSAHRENLQETLKKYQVDALVLAPEHDGGLHDDTGSAIIAHAYRHQGALDELDQAMLADRLSDILGTSVRVLPYDIKQPPSLETLQNQYGETLKSDPFAEAARSFEKTPVKQVSEPDKKAAHGK